LTSSQGESLATAEAGTHIGDALRGAGEEQDWETDAGFENDVSGSRYRWGHQGTGGIVDVTAIRRQVQEANAGKTGLDHQTGVETGRDPTSL